jgi:hypothetical protein
MNFSRRRSTVRRVIPVTFELDDNEIMHECLSPDSIIYDTEVKLSTLEMQEFQYEDPSYLTYMLYYKILLCLGCTNVHD